MWISDVLRFSQTFTCGGGHLGILDETNVSGDCRQHLANELTDPNKIRLTAVANFIISNRYINIYITISTDLFLILFQLNHDLKV